MEEKTFEGTIVKLVLGLFLSSDRWKYLLKTKTRLAHTLFKFLVMLIMRWIIAGLDEQGHSSTGVLSFVTFEIQTSNKKITSYD